MGKYKAVSLFCGAGGLDLGFHNRGVVTIWANDFDKDACETYQNWNHDALVICGDIASIDEKDVPSCDVMLGGFPCQGFSLAGPRRLDDSRNKLFKEYVRLLRAKRPLCFIGENVKGLLTMGGGEVFEAIKEEFASCGYDVFVESVNAKDFGVPQDRKRVILAGFRKDLEVDSFTLPLYHAKAKTLKDALENLEPAKEEEICRDAFSSRYMSRNRRRDWNEPSFTIPAMSKQVALHPSSPCMIKLEQDLWKFGEGETRRLSFKECAAIQTFPPEIEFAGNLTSKYKQIGNAVPVKLAEIIAGRVVEILDSHC